MITRGIQVDVTVRKREIDGQIVEVPFCDHDCWSNDYRCPSAQSLARGRVVSNYAPAELLVRAVGNVDRGLRRRWPDGETEINLFGGNAAIHPDVLPMISTLSDKGYAVCLSMPGRRFLVDPEFGDKLVAASLGVVAFSVDDIAAWEIDDLMRMTDRQLSLAYRQAGWRRGQKQKAVSAIYAAKVLQGWAVTVLFNVVVHPGNLLEIPQIIESLARHFPNVLINPFPAQSSFYGGDPIFGKEHVDGIIDLIERMLAGSLPNTLDRPFYWSTLQKAIQHQPDKFCWIMSGYAVWKCTHGRNPYVQIGRCPPGYSGEKYPGGYLNCFWNPHGRGTIQMWDASEADVDEELASFGSPGCLGCIMPRLMFDRANTEAGLVVPAQHRNHERRTE